RQYCLQKACKVALLVQIPGGVNPFWEPTSWVLL
ncbi:hypothetical protein DBR06_SOUSAS6610001, partial [Sousa chinensis]